MTEEKEDEKAVKLIEVQDEVRKLIKFDVTPKELKDIVEISKKITVPNLEDKGQLKIAKDMKIKLRKFGIDTENQVKDYRSFFNTINKEISKGGKDLIAITTGEIDRLAGILEEADKLELENERKAMLPIRKERLLGIDKTGCYICFDENLLEMDAEQFEAYFNNCVANKNERNRVQLEDDAEAKRQKETRELAKQKYDFRVEKLNSIGLQNDPNKFGFYLPENEKEVAMVIGISAEEVEKDDTETFERKFTNIQSQIGIRKQFLKDRVETEARRVQLPTRLGRLEAIGDKVPVSEDVILGMDDNQFDAYVNKRVSDKNQAETNAIENKRIADEQATENKRLADEEVENKKKAIEKTEKEVALITTGIDLKTYRDNELRKYEEQYGIIAKRLVVLETEEGEEASKKALEKKAKYQTFLKEKGWTPETRDQFESRAVKGGFELWKKVGMFTDY